MLPTILVVAAGALLVLWLEWRAPKCDGVCERDKCNCGEEN